MSNRYRGRMASATAIALSISLAASGAAVAQARKSVTIGTAISLEMMLPVFAAKQDHCFTDQGLDLQMTALGGPQSRDALAAGETNFALFHVTPVWLSIEKGLPFKYVSMYYSKEIFGLLASSRVKDRVKNVKELKSLRGLSNTPGSASSAVLSYYLRRSGLDINKDVEMVYVASTDAKVWLSTIETGRVDFIGGVWEPIYTAALERGGAYSLFDAEDTAQHTAMFGGDVSTVGLVTTTNLIAKDPGLVKETVACINKGLALIHSATDDALVQATVDSGIVNMDRNMLTNVIHRIRGNFEADGRPSKSKYARAVNAYVTGGFLKQPIPYDDAIDSSIAGSAP